MEFSPKWKDRAEQALAVCQQESIDPRLYVRFLVETMGWFCNEKGMPMQAAMLFNAKSGDKYNAWQARQRERGSRTEVVSLKSDERRVDKFLRGMGKLYLGGTSLNKARLASAEEHLGQTIQFDGIPDGMLLDRLVHYLSSFDPTLPDRLLLRSNWTLDDVLFVSFRVLGLKGKAKFRLTEAA